MDKQHSSDVTDLLLAWSAGDALALDRLLPIVHRELHRIAKRHMSGERFDHTLQATALVNEAYMRLMDLNEMQWQNRAHFFAVCATVMRRILVDLGRKRHYLKRGGGERPILLNEERMLPSKNGIDVVALDDALHALAASDPRKARIVELRFFGGLSAQETAEILNVSPDTVSRDWRFAKVWLKAELTRTSRGA
jgi:RNA polymerase sigma factor (TIGR02999 family)